MARITAIALTKRRKQYANVDLESFKEKRKAFTTDEWVDVLINTISLNPNVYSERGKILLLSRLIPLVEQNVNIFELGPRATGNSFLPKNIIVHFFI